VWTSWRCAAPKSTLGQNVSHVVFLVLERRCAAAMGSAREVELGKETASVPATRSMGATDAISAVRTITRASETRRNCSVHLVIRLAKATAQDRGLRAALRARVASI